MRAIRCPRRSSRDRSAPQRQRAFVGCRGWSAWGSGLRGCFAVAGGRVERPRAIERIGVHALNLSNGSGMAS
jgi:hypothetical protein